MYTDARVIAAVDARYIPVRAHVKEDSAEFQRLGAKFDVQWTPTILISDSSGQERHRIEGFLPADDFLAQLALGAAKAAFSDSDFNAAAGLFDEVVKAYPKTDAAPEAQYWAGVSRYKATSDPSALNATFKKFQERYTDSTWAKKASVWGK